MSNDEAQTNIVKHRTCDRVSNQKLLSEVFIQRLKTACGGFSAVINILVITSSSLSWGTSCDHNLWLLSSLTAFSCMCSPAQVRGELWELSTMAALHITVMLLGSIDSVVPKQGKNKLAVDLCTEICTTLQGKCLLNGISSWSSQHYHLGQWSEWLVYSFSTKGDYSVTSLVSQKNPCV